MNFKPVLVSIAVLATAASLVGGSAASAGTRPAPAKFQLAPAHAQTVLTAGLISENVTKYGAVLADRNGRTLYLLDTEAGAKLHCTSKSCLAYWPPLVYTKGQKVTTGMGVKGKVGFVARSKTTLQVTFNGYPVYLFVGDSGTARSNGEGVRSFGGTWYMLHPAATSASHTPVAPK